MFPRKKKNKTGTISVVVVDKSRGGYKEIKSFGVAKTEEDADRLYAKAAKWVRKYGGQQEIDFVQSSIVQQELLESERVLNNISAVVLNGPQQIPKPPSTDAATTSSLPSARTCKWLSMNRKSRKTRNGMV